MRRPSIVPSRRAVLLVGLAALLGVLGTATLAASRANAPRLTIAPASVRLRSAVSFAGSGYVANEPVTVAIGPPFSEARFVARARSDARGDFRLDRRLPSWVSVGRWVAIACQRSCRIKAGTPLRVVAPSGARRATPSEAAAIRRAAVRSLGDSGWHASAILVSTLSPAHRYARASLDNVDGIGFEMILRQDGTRWRRIYLAANGLCVAPAPVRVLRDLGFGC